MHQHRPLLLPADHLPLPTLQLTLYRARSRPARPTFVRCGYGGSCPRSSIYDNHQGVGLHGRFDLHVIRTDVNPPVEFAYWGVDPNELANVLNPNLPNNGAIVLPPGSYSIAFGIGVQTNTQDAGPPMSGQLSTYSENRIATATFQFVTAETVPPPIQGTAGKIPETGYDATLLTTYSTTLFYDLMTLCSPRWVSPQTYEMLLGQGLALMGQ